MAKNPFKQDMKTLKAPEGCGAAISVGGFELEIDDKGCVEVPSAHVDSLKSHGFTEQKDQPVEQPKRR